MEMIDQKTGETYCTWIANGEWKKAKGTCSSIDFNNPPATESLASAPTQAQQTASPTNNQAQTQQQETPPVQAQQQSQELTQQQQHAIEQAADQAAREASQQTASRVVDEVKKEIKEEVQTQIEAQASIESQAEATPSETQSAEETKTETQTQEAPVESPQEMLQEPVPAPALETTEAPSAGDLINEASAALFQKVWEVFSWVFKIFAEKTVSLLPDSIKEAPAGVYKLAKTNFQYLSEQVEVALEYKTPQLIEQSTAGFIAPIKNLWEHLKNNDW